MHLQSYALDTTGKKRGLPIMTATRKDISLWFDEGVDDGRTYMIVAVDTFDWDNYPVYCDTDEQVKEDFKRLNGPNMQQVDEVYDLRQPKDEQMREYRAMRLPK